MILPVRLLCAVLATALAVGVEVEAADWQRMPPREFGKLPEVNAPIDFARYDRGLMAAAIFHETNRVRQQQDLRVFRHLSQLDDAADSQASIGALLLEVSHHNPLPSLADVSDRVRATGLVFEMVAENIALIPTLAYDPAVMELGAKGTGVGKRFIDLKTGRELATLSYAEFATKVVQQWMDSPGHRANLVNPALSHLGCSARWRKGLSGADLLYAVQVFYTPQNPKPDNGARIRKPPQ